MVDQATTDKITSWYQTNLGRAPEAGVVDWWGSQAPGTDIEAGIKGSDEAKAYASKPAGMLPTVGTAPSNPPASQPAADVGSWYRTVLGRDAEQGGLDYWNNQLKTNSADDVYKSFTTAANTNSERVNPTLSWQQANSYSGPNSVNTTTPVDDWGRNVLGRELTPSELKQWQAKFDAAGGVNGSADAARGVYDEFLQSYGGQVKSPMDLTSASQINSGLKKPPATPNAPTGLTTIDINDLDHRKIDPKTETVKGQMTDLLAEDSPYMVQARYDAMKAAAERGMLNSTMAASGGEDAAIRSALNIATPDAAAYGRAGDYNVAVNNQTRLWNADQANQFARQQAQLDQQMSIAQLQDATSRFVNEQNNATSRYGTDATSENTRKSLVNNVMMNMEYKPDRKAAMLEALGEGKSATTTTDANGKTTVTPGSGLAGAVYIIDDVADELRNLNANGNVTTGPGWDNGVFTGVGNT